MAERDPFGRLPDENPLAGLGALSDNTQIQSPEPVVVSGDHAWSAGPSAAEAKPAPPRPAPAAPPRSTGNPAVDQSLAEVIRQAQAMSGANVVQSARMVGRIVRLVVLLIVIGVLASVGSTLFSAGKDVKDAISGLPSPSKVANDIKTPASAPKSNVEEPSTPTGLSSRSMLLRSNFRPAMAKLAASGLGHVRTLSIRPERIDAQLLTNGGSLRSVQIKFDEPRINDFGTGGSGFGHLETIPFARINTAAPARLARSAAGRVQKPVSQIDYVVLISFARVPTWSAFTKNGKQFLANSRGQITRRIN